jgi:hypothetical protein
MGPSSALSPFIPHALFDLDPAFILDMPVTVGVDLEARLVSEQSKFRGAGMCLVLSWDVRQSLLIREAIVTR